MKKLLVGLFAVFILGLTGCQAKDERAFFELVGTYDINPSNCFAPYFFARRQSR